MSKQQHRYDAPIQQTQNMARVKAIVYRPHRPGGAAVEVVYSIGAEIGGIFTENEVEKAFIKYDDLPGPVQTSFDDLEAKALNYGETNGLFPSGTVEET